MSNTIIEALIKKGSLGGNNIMDAVENLPSGGSGSGSYAGLIGCSINMETGIISIDATYNDLIGMVNNDIIPVAAIEMSSVGGSYEGITMCYLTTLTDGAKTGGRYFASFIDMPYALSAASADEILMHENTVVDDGGAS